jgi:RNA polymerase sigma factor (TIGR02999 family)
MTAQPVMPEPTGDVTGLLLAWGDGDRHALDRLVPLVYEELRSLAHRALRRERPGGTIQTTALVHEAYLRLVDQKRARVESRNHFLSLAAQMMRRVLVDEARRRGAAKRGADDPQLSLADLDLPDRQRPDDVVALDDALTRLEALDPNLSRLVELRYFAGLSLEEAADVLGISKTGAWRDWQTARAWLYDALGAGGPVAP